MKKEINLKLNQRLKTKLTTFLKVNLSNKLSLKEKEVVDLIQNLEETDEFQKLLELRIIKRNPTFPSRFSIRPFCEYIDNVFSPKLDNNLDIKNFMDENFEVVDLIRKIGEENYKRFFLGSENYSFEEISDITGISKNEVKKIFEFTNNIFIQAELPQITSSLYQKESIPKRYTKIAKIDISDNDFVITYIIPSMFRGRYDIDYDKLNDYIKNQPPSKKKEIKNLIKELKLLEIRKISLHRILEEIIFIQKEFIKTELEKKLKICTQKDLSSKIGISASSICRLIQERSIILPSGKEYPLEYFFVNKKKLALIYIDEILSKQKDIKDNQLKDLLFKKLNIRFSRRTINYYKNLIKNLGTKN